MQKLAAIILIQLMAITGNAQAIDYSPVYRSINTEKSFRFSYENDFFSASDRDYTQGVYLEFIHPILKRSILSKLLWHPNASRSLHGIAIETDGYTPNHIDRTAIQDNDRPYASTLLIRWFNTAIRTAHKERITNTFTIGVLGSLAGGREIQTTIHNWIGYTRPLGWHNQIANEPVLNYQLNYEKTIWQQVGNIQVDFHGMVRAGTLSTKATTGLSIMVGKLINPYDEYSTTHNFTFHAYDHIAANAVVHDATLQGGLINRKSQYTIASNYINRLVLQNRIGLVVRSGAVTLEYWQSFLTREFKTGIEPKTGGLQFGLVL